PLVEGQRRAVRGRDEQADVGLLDKRLLLAGGQVETLEDEDRLAGLVVAPADDGDDGDAPVGRQGAGLGEAGVVGQEHAGPLAGAPARQGEAGLRAAPGGRQGDAPVVADGQGQRVGEALGGGGGGGVRLAAGGVLPQAQARAVGGGGQERAVRR